MHVHILGICGTFMGGIAALAKAAGHTVSGCDNNVYPPMSTQLERLGIELTAGWDPDQLSLAPDVFIIGNVVSRGNPLMEAILNAGLPYTSGPQWLAEHVLQGRDVIAVAGTHGKTTTSSLIAYLLEATGQQPGFLIGGVPADFGVSARLGAGRWFVVEADEYDTAFFDKRAKFVHYRPRIAVLNNLEFDHADIYDDLAAIEWQFHQLLRTVPANGAVVANGDDTNLQRVIAAGCWSEVSNFSTHDDVGEPSLRLRQGSQSDNIERLEEGEWLPIPWAQNGPHNVQNTAAALLALSFAGVSFEESSQHLLGFNSVSRRMQCIASAAGINVFDDFAHHPTAIRMTLQGMRDAGDARRIIAAFEPRSNTMKQGVHAAVLGAAFDKADRVFVLAPEGMTWDVAAAFDHSASLVTTLPTTDALFDAITNELKTGDQLVVMSNGAFGGLPQRLAKWVESTYA